MSIESIVARQSGRMTAVEVSRRPIEILLQELHHRVWEVRRDACEELGGHREARAIMALIQMLDDGVGAVRFCAAESLGKVGDRYAVAALIKQLKNPNFGSFAPLVESLAMLKPPEAIPHFIELLKSDDVRLRGVAANALMVMTRQFIAFKAKGTQEERDAAIAQWEAWWEKQRTATPTPQGT
jgi:HEAT repeat protein